MTEFPYLDRFRARVSPPPRPTFGTQPWDQVFAELGTQLPPDFVAFVELYGASSFGNGFLFVGDSRQDLQAFGKSYAQLICEQGDRYRQWRKMSCDLHPMPAWPEPGGFLSWGGDVDGNVFGWLTQGAPHQWPTAVFGRQLPDGIIDHVPMTQFLCGWLTTPITYPHCLPTLPGLLDDEDLDDNEEPKPHIVRELICRSL
ncbi:hypothetical protein [Actinomadura kijaniata]|uniref:hypothetical protein n=1 Tax=Actinomadura kijaniata TaxID=46161 RepID=UPI000832C766|nr:hypothetical protein [Actinomadura kijaniata]